MTATFCCGAQPNNLGVWKPCTAVQVTTCVCLPAACCLLWCSAWPDSSARSCPRAHPSSTGVRGSRGYVGATATECYPHLVAREVLRHCAFVTRQEPWRSRVLRSTLASGLAEGLQSKQRNFSQSQSSLLVKAMKATYTSGVRRRPALSVAHHSGGHQCSGIIVVGLRAGYAHPLIPAPGSQLCPPRLLWVPA